MYRLAEFRKKQQERRRELIGAMWEMEFQARSKSLSIKARYLSARAYAEIRAKLNPSSWGGVGGVL